MKQLAVLLAMLRWLRRTPLIPTTIIIIFVFVAIFADFITPRHPYEISIENRLQPPFWMEGGSWSFPLGTDTLGRDILSRIIYGTRTVLTVCLSALLLGAMLGTAIGLIAAYSGGRVDAVLMRITDSTLGFPIILFALLLVVTLGPSTFNVIFAIGLVLWARYARIIRGEALSLMQRDFIAQARVAGCSASRMMVRHLLPNLFNTLIVLITLQVGWVVIIEASLSFLGAGVPPPMPSWGGMVAAGRDYITSAWWLAIFPGFCVLFLVMSFNLFGDWLRDILDPKLRQL